jgi:hypothetical protein
MNDEWKNTSFVYHKIIESKRSCFKALASAERGSTHPGSKTLEIAHRSNRFSPIAKTK